MRNDLQAAVEYFKSLLQTIADDEWNREARNSATAALSALRDALQRQPDPITGLVPCGCGGKAKCLHHLTPDGDYAVKCGKCKIMTDWFNSPEDAIKAFNTAMGCIAAPMNPWIRTNEQPPTEMDACNNGWVLALAAYQSPDNPVRLPAADIVDWSFPVNCPELYPYWMPLPKPPEVEG